MVYRGHVCTGKIELEEPSELPEGAEVEVALREEVQQTDGTRPSHYESLKDFIGVIDDLPEDFSANHDRYLYGHPMR